MPDIAMPGIVFMPGLFAPGVLVPGLVAPDIAMPGTAPPGVFIPAIALPGVLMPDIAPPEPAAPGAMRRGSGPVASAGMLVLRFALAPRGPPAVVRSPRLPRSSARMSAGSRAVKSFSITTTSCSSWDDPGSRRISAKFTRPKHASDHSSNSARGTALCLMIDRSVPIASSRWSGMGTVTLPASVRRCMTI
jgi:hypothetical protein